MGAVLKVLTRPWRVLGRARALKDAVATHVRELLALQRATRAEVRELHQSSLLAAIHLIEEQRRAREALAQDYARLERRLAALEAELAAARAAPAAG